MMASKARAALGIASLWVGLLGLAFALPPMTIFFLVPGFWIDGLKVTTKAAPALAAAAALMGAVGLRGARPRQARAGMWLGLATLGCMAALLVRLWALLAVAAREAV
jgi:hypothetical protein